MLFSYRKATCTMCTMLSYVSNLPSAYRKSQAELREQIDQLSEGNSVNMLIQGSIYYIFEWGTTTVCAIHGLARVWYGPTGDMCRLNYVVASQVVTGYRGLPTKLHYFPVLLMLTL